MSRTIPLLVALILLPTTLADPGPGAEPGLGTACGASLNEKPCRGIIPNTNVTAGTHKTYTGSWRATGTVVVEAGGTVTVHDANVTFDNTSGGFIVLSGGTLHVLRSELMETTSDAPFVLRADPASVFTLNDTRVLGGEGVRVATSAVNMSGNRLQGIALALRLDDVTALVHHNEFVNNTVAVNQTGGMPQLEHNAFLGGEVCVRDWRSDPTIRYNVFRGCHTGIWHEQSESTLSFNDMEDQMNPPGAAMVILGGLSPTIEGNTIRHYGTGIHIIDARAYVRNNTIAENLGDGIRVESNAAPMDIQGNAILGNGGAGIRLVDVADLPVFANTVRDNAGDGIVVSSSPDMVLRDNVVDRNGGMGIAIDEASPRATLFGNLVTRNAGDGIAVRAAGTSVAGGSASGNGAHGIRLDHALDVRLDGIEALANTRDGVFIGASSATIVRVNASLNLHNGFTYDPMGPFQLLGSTDMSSVRAIGNGASGVLNVEGNATFIEDGWFERNEGAGVRNADLASVIDARQSYWGSPTGPTTPLNPGGQGDEVEGNVLFAPFRSAPPP